MAKALRVGLRNGGLRRGGLRPGLGNGSIFSLASLDLRFAQQKSLGPLVTFTRASSGTFVGSDGVLQAAVTNLLLRSEEFDNASWVKARASVSLNATTAPNGTATADALIEDTTASASHIAYQNLNLGVAFYTISVYAKASTRTQCYLRIDTNASSRVVVFDLTTGTPTNGSGIVGSATLVGNGWYRCTATLTAAENCINAVVGLALAGSTAYTGDGTSGLFLWGAQLEQSSSVGEYIPTTSTINSAPRFDHNPTTGESLGLLVEEQRVNLLLRSAELDNVTSWTFAGGTLTANNFAAPDSTQSADTVTLPAGGAVVSLFQVVSCTASTTYTFSFYARLGTLLANDFTFAVRDDTNAAFIAVDIVPGVTLSSTQWNRVTYTFTTPVGCVLVRPYLIRRGSTPGGTVHFWGAQLEAGAFPTSYIPTTTATVTRSADVCSITGTAFSSFYRQDEGSFFVSHDARQVLLVANNNSFNERQPQMGLSAALIHDFYNITGGIIQANNTGLAHVIGTTSRAAYTYKTNDFIGAVNGSLTTSDSSGSVSSSVSQLNIGVFQNGGGGACGTLRRICFWPTRLPNSTLQAVTQ